MGVQDWRRPTPPAHGESGQGRNGNAGNGSPQTLQSLFFGGRRWRKPVALVAAALPSPRVLATLRRARGKQREQRPTQARAPTEKPASLCQHEVKNQRRKENRKQSLC